MLHQKGNNIEGEGGAALCKGLEVNTALTALDLSGICFVFNTQKPKTNHGNRTGNNIGETGAVSLCKALSVNTTFVAVNMSCTITSKNIKQTINHKYAEQGAD